MKGIVFYTANDLEEPIFSVVQEQLAKVNLPLVSVSLEPMNFGTNIVFDGKKGTTTMFRQILAGLEASTADVIFLCENDVLYHPSHFDFTPPDDKFYYGVNVFRWDYPSDRAITYDHLRSVSGLCANRQVLLNHYRNLVKTIEEKGWKDSKGEPKWARIIGYEPGKVKNSMSPELTSEWKSEYPNVDIRHGGTMTKRKTRLEDFKHKPANFREVFIEQIPGWDLSSIFNL